jgi:RNA polymerase sigma factor (sigma-70 family)
VDERGVRHPPDANRAKESAGARRRIGVGAAEPEDLEHVYRSRHREFTAVAAAILGDVAEAADVVQDAFATALRKRRRFRSEGPLEAWVWRIVLNKARDRKRKARWSPLVETAEAPLSANGYAADAAVRVVLANLPQRQREVVFLRYFAGLEYAQIADLLGISTGTVGATLNSAHAALRREMAERE